LWTRLKTLIWKIKRRRELNRVFKPFTDKTFSIWIALYYAMFAVMCFVTAFSMILYLDETVFHTGFYVKLWWWWNYGYIPKPTLIP